MSETVLERKDVPAPGSYNVAQSYVKSQVHPVVAKPRTLEASRNQQSFVSSTPRFPQRKDPRIPACNTVHKIGRQEALPVAHEPLYGAKLWIDVESQPVVVTWKSFSIFPHGWNGLVHTGRGWADNGD
ncbi:hypothetical protein ACOMHN_052741 [Nucella lapillus]